MRTITNTEGAAPVIGSIRVVGIDGEKFKANNMDELIARIDGEVAKATGGRDGGVYRVLTHPKDDDTPAADKRGANVAKTDRRYIFVFHRGDAPSLDEVVRRLERAGVIVEA